MEGVPVVEVVEHDGVADFSFVGDSVGFEDGGADVVGVIVAGDVGVDFRDGGGIQRATGLSENPRFEFGIGRFAVSDEAFKRSLVETEGGENHSVVAVAAGWIIRVELARRAERGLEPEAWQVKNAEGAGGAGADHGDDVRHGLLG